MDEGDVRRLVRSYPRADRQERGRELLEAAPGRLGWRLRITVIRRGLRARLGRPASRTVVLWSLLVAVYCGLVGASFAVRLAWETVPLAPERAEATAILHEALPGHEFVHFGRSPDQFVIFATPVDLDALLAEGAEYEQGGSGGDLASADLTVAAQGLRDNGWRVDGPTVGRSNNCIAAYCDAASREGVESVTASRGDLVAVFARNPPGVTPTYMLVLKRATPWSAYPAGLAGGLLVGGVAWWLFAWVSRRTGTRVVARVISGVLLIPMLVAWWMPVLYTLPFVVSHHIAYRHPSWHPVWEWIGQPAFVLLLLAGAAVVPVAILVAALTPRGARAG